MDTGGFEPKAAWAGEPRVVPGLDGSACCNLLTMARPAVKACASWFFMFMAEEYKPAAERVRDPRYSEASEAPDRREAAPER